MVMDETKYKERVVLKVKKKKLTPEEFGKTNENWKKISLNFPVKNASTLSRYDWLYPLLTDVEFLSLRLHGSAPPSCSTLDFYSLLGRLLESCKKLKSLALEPDLLRIASSPISAGIDTLQNLQELEFLQPDPNRSPLWDDEDTREHDDRVTDDFVCADLKRIKSYRSYFPRFRINPLQPGDRRTWYEARFLSLFSSLMALSKMGDQLESHSFYDLSHPSLGLQIKAADFMYETPALTAVDADANQLEQSGNVLNFITYLDHRPLLEQIDISCHYYDPEDGSVLSRLIPSIARHGRSLKKLKMLIKLESLSDWIFLRESSLRELHLEDYGTTAGANEWIRQVMNNLPKTMEKLYLKGAMLQRGQKKKHNSVTEPLKKELFARLDPQLVTQLSIFNAGGLVDNEVADLICKNFWMLRKFNISEAQTDDEGFREIGGLKGKP